MPGSRGRRARRVVAAVSAGALLLGLAACTPSGGGGDGGADATASASPSPSISPTPTPTAAYTPTGTLDPPPEGAAFDYQLGGGYTPPAGVTVVVRDSTDSPAEGYYNICYVNGFQGQPDAGWPDVLVLHDASGDVVYDPDWPDEAILDISTPDNRQAIAARLAVTIAGCAAAGYQAVEFDNLDSYTRSDGAFDLQDSIALARLLVQSAHEAGLAAGQKNTVELGESGRTLVGFDFAVAEECQAFGECADYTAVYGQRVFDIEYRGALSGTFAEVCADPSRPPATILRDRDLVPKGESGYVYQRC